MKPLAAPDPRSVFINVPSIRVLRQSAQQFKREHKVTSLFRPALFRSLAAAATDVGIDRGFIKP